MNLNTSKCECTKNKKKFCVFLFMTIVSLVIYTLYLYKRNINAVGNWILIKSYVQDKVMEYATRENWVKWNIITTEMALKSPHANRWFSEIEKYSFGTDKQKGFLFIIDFDGKM